MKQTALAVVVLLACSLSAGATTIRGVVQNGTTKRPSSGDEVTLKRAGNGMEEVGKTTSNAKGEFVFDVPSSQLPYIVFVKHQGINYTEVAEPGGPALTIRVYEALPAVNNITLQQRMMVVQSDGDKLKINELYTVENASKPPRTKAAPRTMEIYLPEGAAVQEAGARTNGVMPLKVAIVPQEEKNRYAFNYPLRPGDTQFTITYTLPYTGKLQMQPRVTVPLAQMMLVAPESIQVKLENGSPFTRTTERQIKDVAIFVATDLNPQKKIGFEIQGSGKLARAKQASGDEAAPASAAKKRSAPAVATASPERSDGARSPQWTFVIVLLLFLAAGATYAYASHTSHKQAVAVGSSRPGLLEALKDETFRLESDRVQGKLSQEEYSRAKAALDKAMLNAVQRSRTS